MHSLLTIPFFAVICIVVAVPTILERNLNSGISIPLTRNGSSYWLHPNNTIDFDRLASHVESVNAKMLRGFEIYERNTGEAHRFHAEGEKEWKRIIKPGGAPLTAVHNLHRDWFTTITIGSPPLPFTVSIDTAFADLFLPGAVCGPSCDGHTRWDPNSSETVEDIDEEFSVHFGDSHGGPGYWERVVAGNLYTDNVTIAGFTADTQTIGVAEEYSPSFEKINYFFADGLLGMAFPSLSDFAAQSLFGTLVEEGKMINPVFSLKLTSGGGELYIGGANSFLYNGRITYAPVVDTGYWEIIIDSIYVGAKKDSQRKINAIIDTGADLIIGDYQRVNRLYTKCGGRSIKNGFYAFPCENVPNFAFSIGGRRFRIPPELLNLGPLYEGSPDCFGAIIGMKRNPAYWSIGAPFLRSVYTIFDYGMEEVGFATLARRTQVEDST